AKKGCVFNAYIDPTCPSFSEKNGLVDNASSNMGNWGSDLEDPIQDQNVVIINYPNPFNNYTTIDYTILNQGYLSIKIYNLFGEEVEIIVGNKFHDPGNYKLQLDTKDLADGVYVCSVQLLAGKDQQNEREELINKHVNDLKGIDQSIENMVMLPTTDEDHESFSLLSDNQTNKALFIKMIKLNNN
ncbi:MAG: T9SS type A sorting domain-containing protein, partial [Bacteroidetes bacterium]|nr:T9SS type A sorting domain-containing protein [Bacteroidota bacterium]